MGIKKTSQERPYLKWSLRADQKKITPDGLEGIRWEGITLQRELRVGRLRNEKEPCQRHKAANFSV